MVFLEVLQLGLEAHLHHRPKHYPGLKEPGFWVVPDSELDKATGAGRMSLLLLRLLWGQAPPTTGQVPAERVQWRLRPNLWGAAG